MLLASGLIFGLIYTSQKTVLGLGSDLPKIRPQAKRTELDPFGLWSNLPNHTKVRSDPISGRSDPPNLADLGSNLWATQVAAIALGAAPA